MAEEKSFKEERVEPISTPEAFMMMLRRAMVAQALLVVWLANQMCSGQEDSCWLGSSSLNWKRKMRP